MITKARQKGFLRIFLYNWPIYLSTWIGAALLCGAASHVHSFALACVMIVAAAGAFAWSAFSLFVSYYVYDRSSLVGGTWIAPLLPAHLRTWATIHAGLDAEIDLDDAVPGIALARLDMFDASVMTAPSIRRARQRTAPMQSSIACLPTALRLGDATCDLIVVPFSAHELRDPSVRERFFDEVHRALRVGGRFLLVEHVRDVANFVAFGPGFLHFQSRAEWLRLAARSQYRVAREARVTPWVMAIAFEKTA